FEDLLRRWLEHSGYDVFHIMNLTDVDDRTIKAARQAGKRLVEHTAPFTKAFFEDRDYLRIRPAHVYTAATEYMPQMIALVSRLLERGVAYKGEDGSVYFAIAKFPTYGRLSQLDKREIKVGSRVGSDEYAQGAWHAEVVTARALSHGARPAGAGCGCGGGAAAVFSDALSPTGRLYGRSARRGEGGRASTGRVP